RPRADLRLAAGAAGRGDRFPAHCTRRAGGRRARSRTTSVTIATALEVVLAAVVLGIATWTVAVRDTSAAVVGFLAYGLLLALIWVRLDAVDVAWAEAAISGGLGGVLLLGAAARLRSTETQAMAERASVVTRAGAGLLSAAVAAALATCVLLL